VVYYITPYLFMLCYAWWHIRCRIEITWEQANHVLCMHGNVIFQYNHRQLFRTTIWLTNLRKAFKCLSWETHAYSSSYNALWCVALAHSFVISRFFLFLIFLVSAFSSAYHFPLLIEVIIFQKINTLINQNIWTI
jgi:hypothetical protein